MCKDDLWNVNDSTTRVDDLLVFEKCWCCFAASFKGLIGYNHTSSVKTSTRMRRDTVRWRRSPRDGERRSSCAAVRFADEALTLMRKVQVERRHVDSAVAAIGNVQDLQKEGHTIVTRGLGARSVCVGLPLTTFPYGR